MLSHVVKVHNALASCPRSIYADLRLHNATVCSTGHRLSVRILDAATLVRNPEDGISRLRPFGDDAHCGGKPSTPGPRKSYVPIFLLLARLNNLSIPRFNACVRFQKSKCLSSGQT